jgi:hypothetical protein
MKHLHYLFFAAWGLSLMPHVHADVPGILSYQGRLSQNNGNYAGPVWLKFALVDGVNGTTYWSNNGSSEDGSEPTEFTQVNASGNGGFFSLMLGDTSLLNMDVIPYSVFSHPDVRLRVWVSTGEDEFTLLTPDQRIAPAGYAMQAATLPNGAVTSAMLADNSVTGAKLADSVTLETLALGGVNWDGTLNLFARPAGGGGIVSPNGEPRGVLMGDALGSEFGLFFNNGTSGVALSSRTTGGRLQLKDATGNDTTVDLSAGGTSGGFLTLRNPDGLTRAFLQGGGVHDGGELQLRDSTGANRLRLYGNAPGYIIDTPSAGGIDFYDLNGLRRISMRGGDGTMHLPQVSGVEGVFLAGQALGGSGGMMSVRQGDGDTGVLLRGQSSAGSGGEMELYDPQNDRRVLLQGVDGTLQLLDESGASPTLRATGDLGELVALYRVGVARIVDASVLQASLGLDSNGGLVRTRDESDNTTSLLGSNAAGGFLRLYQGDGTEGIEMDGDAGGGGLVSLRDADTTATIKLIGEQPGASGGRIEMSQGNGALTVILDGEVGAGGGGYLQLRNGAGTGTITLDSDSAGDGRVTTQVLEITGGSDFSENFDIRTGDAQPGMLVSIDPAHPGELAVSERAYDRTVAGVVSGAGGVKPGLRMGQRNSVADGSHPVALTGRVYCLVDADRGAVEPGDLITTSDTPGHGMKVSDYARAHGAIIGKAMTPLAGGSGLVLVLVSLQ